jgi:hypothetical protein
MLPSPPAADLQSDSVSPGTALGKDIRKGNAVCYRELAGLLLHEDLAVIRVRVVAFSESRIGTASGLCGHREPKAIAFLRKVDH